jgi:LysR family transcriptional regulator, transcriptional activator for aaeXAB operon
MNNIKMLPSLLIFAEVSKQQSFTLAAKQLGMSKSAVSQQVKRLEIQTGQQLLSRHTRGMSLTTAGEKLLSRCELLQDQVNLAFAEIDSSKETPSGVFSITIPHSLEREIVIPALSQLCIEFPNIQPRLLVSDQMQDLIKNNLDVALSFGELKDSHYRALPVGVVGEIICASAVYVQRC